MPSRRSDVGKCIRFKELNLMPSDHQGLPNFLPQAALCRVPRLVNVPNQGVPQGEATSTLSASHHAFAAQRVRIAVFAGSKDAKAAAVLSLLQHQIAPPARHKAIPVEVLRGHDATYQRACTGVSRPLLLLGARTHFPHAQSSTPAAAPKDPMPPALRSTAAAAPGYQWPPGRGARWRPG